MSGFLEGDGGFYVPQNLIRVNKKKDQAYIIKQRFYISQKDGVDLFTQIRTLLKITAPITKFANKVLNPKTGLKEKRLYDRIETATLESAQILLEYLTRFPFLGKRQITVDSWKRVIVFRETKFPVTAERTAILQKLVNQTKKVESVLQDNPEIDLDRE